MRAEKSVKIILSNISTTYKKALKDINMDSLKKRRKKTCLKKAKSKRYQKSPVFYMQNSHGQEKQSCLLNLTLNHDSYTSNSVKSSLTSS